MDKLSETLTSITGASSKQSFDAENVCISRSLFAIARDVSRQPLGCSALRPMDKHTAEIKRMYAR